MVKIQLQPGTRWKRLASGHVWEIFRITHRGQGDVSVKHTASPTEREMYERADFLKKFTPVE